MNKSIHISLVKDENNLYHADMLIDDNIVKQADITQKELSEYMQEKLEPEVLSMSRLGIKLFKSKQIKLHLKE
jgi:hypothetical protein